MTPQDAVALLIGNRLIRVNGAVHFNDESSGVAVEIYNETID